MIGKIISHYKILDKLGEGGMGIVYKALDTKLDRIVALKFLPRHLLSNEVAKTRFCFEAKAASVLNHPNITTIYEIDEVANDCFICMEYVEGSSLKDLITQRILSVEEILNIAIQVAEGLNAAHKKRVIHRDIKSENIMLTSEGVVKITDFGLAKLQDTSSVTVTGSVLGTLDYMSPEQVQGLALDNRSDIFSFGVVLYEMITGQRPFKGDHPAALIYSILNDNPEPLARYKAGFPGELQRICDRTLQKDIETRYQHMDELLVDIKQLQRNWDRGKVDTTLQVDESYKPSLAVLYLENMGGREEDNYFVAGMTEDIITDLCAIEGIRVLSRTDVLPLRGKDINIKEIGRKLSVDYVLEGSVRKANNKLRVSAQLIKTSDGFHVWADRYDEDLGNVFDIQSEVAQKIARSLKIKLSPSEITQMEKKPTVSIQAYDYYLRGRDYYFRLSKTDLENAIRLFQRALEIDPDYALAYAGLADAYVYKYEAYYDRSLSILNEAEIASQKALSINPDLPEAHRSLGRVYVFKKTPEKAIQEFKAAVRLRPNFHEACRALGWIHEEMRDYGEAVKWTNMALDIRPADKESWFLLGIVYYDQQLFSIALGYFNKALEVAPDYGTAHYYVGSTFLKSGKLDMAMEQFKKCVSAAGCDPNVYLDLGWIYLLKKDYHNSLQFFQKSIDNGLFDFLAYYFQGITHQESGNQKKSLQCFEKCIQLCSRQLASDPENPYLRSTLALSHLIMGNVAEAERNIEVCHKLAPDNGAILYDIARFYALRKDQAKSIELLKQALTLPLGPSKFEVRLDPHFKNLLGNPAFSDLTES